MAAKIDLAKLSLADLKALQKSVEKEIKNFKSRARDAAMKDLQAVAKKHGLSVDEIIGKKGSEIPEIRCSGKIRQSRRPQPDLVGTRTPTRLVQGCIGQGEIGQKPGNLNRITGRQSAARIHLGIVISARNPPRSRLSPNSNLPPCWRAISAAIVNPSPTPRPLS